MELERFKIFVRNQKIKKNKWNISKESLASDMYSMDEKKQIMTMQITGLFVIGILMVIVMFILKYVQSLNILSMLIVNAITLIIIIGFVFILFGMIGSITHEKEFMTYDEVYKHYNKNNESIFDEELFNYLSIREAELDISRKTILFNNYDITYDLLKCKTLEEQFILINDLRMKV